MNGYNEDYIMKFQMIYLYHMEILSW